MTSTPSMRRLLDGEVWSLTDLFAHRLGGVQRSVQHRARSPQPAPTSPYAGAEAYTLAYSGAPPSQILAGAPPPLPPPVRNPTGPTSARENALEARELALEERLRYVEAMLAAKTRMEGSVSRGAVLRGNQSVSQVII